MMKLADRANVFRLLLDRIGRFSGSKDISQQRSKIQGQIAPCHQESIVNLVQICFGWMLVSDASGSDLGGEYRAHGLDKQVYTF